LYSVESAIIFVYDDVVVDWKNYAIIAMLEIAVFSTKNSTIITPSIFKIF